MPSKVEYATRLRKTPPYRFAAIGAQIRQLQSEGVDIIRLDQGAPDLPPPASAVDYLARAVANPKSHSYPSLSGLPALRSSFASYYKRRFGVLLDPDREVVPVIGSKEGLVNLQLALLDPDDVVLIPDPGYPIYQSGAVLAGARVYPVALDPVCGYLPILSDIPSDIADKAKLLWINYPNNPTGGVATLADLSRIVEFCAKHNILLASDNPYADLAYEGFRPPSLLEVPGAREIAVEFNSASKLLNMAGWRIGVCVGNRDIVAGLAQIKSNIDTSMFVPLQEACAFALDTLLDDWIDQRNRVYQRRRDIVMDALPRIGLSADRPKGAMYVWGKVASGNDEKYVHDALEHAGVSITPGSVYGERGTGYIRISLVVSEERIGEAMERLARVAR